MDRLSVVHRWGPRVRRIGAFNTPRIRSLSPSDKNIYCAAEPVALTDHGDVSASYSMIRKWVQSANMTAQSPANKFTSASAFSSARQSSRRVVMPLHFVRWWESTDHTGDLVERDPTEIGLGRPRAG